MGPIVIYTYGKNLEDPYSRFEVNAKELKKYFFRQLIPYNQGLNFFSEKQF